MPKTESLYTALFIAPILVSYQIIKQLKSITDVAASAYQDRLQVYNHEL